MILVAFFLSLPRPSYAAYEDLNWFWYGDTRSTPYNTWVSISDYVQVYLLKTKDSYGHDLVYVFFKSDTFAEQKVILFNEVWKWNSPEPPSNSWLIVRWGTVRQGNFTCSNCGYALSVSSREWPDFHIRAGIESSVQIEPPEPEEPTDPPEPEPEPDPEPPDEGIIAKNPYKNLIDNIFSLPESIIELVKGKLVGASNLVAQGIDISAWLAPVSILGLNWVRVINALLAGATLVFTFWIAKKVYNLYLLYKQGVKWW